jgi:hypothetical protein
MRQRAAFFSEYGYLVIIPRVALSSEESAVPPVKADSSPTELALGGKRKPSDQRNIAEKNLLHCRFQHTWLDVYMTAGLWRSKRFGKSSPQPQKIKRR